MSEKFLGRYRVKSARAQWWNYSWDGSYFVTVCTRNKTCFFGHIEDNHVLLSELGKIALAQWLEIPLKFPYTRLGEFVIMPNHVHGIIILQKDQVKETIQADHLSMDNIDNDQSSKDGNHLNEVKSFRIKGGITGKYNPMLHNSLSRVMRWYTGRVSFECHKIDLDFNWQRRFFDQIIFDKNAYRSISNYIKRNPSNWENDTFFKPTIK